MFCVPLQEEHVGGSAGSPRHSGSPARAHSGGGGLGSGAAGMAGLPGVHTTPSPKAARQPGAAQVCVRACGGGWGGGLDEGKGVRLQLRPAGRLGLEH